jgi:hypothetical protein
MRSTGKYFTGFRVYQDSRFVRDLPRSQKIVQYNMSFTRLAAALLALLLMSTTGTGGPKSNTTHRRSMALRDIAEINGDLAVIVGAIGPNSFFENLRPVDSKDRTVFLNDFGKAVFFPDRMTITLFIVGPIPREHGRTSGFDAQYMNELKFKAEWKRGIELRPVKTFRQLTASVTEPPSFAVSLGVRECWVYVRSRFHSSSSVRWEILV